MESPQLPKYLRLLLWLVLAHEIGWFLYEVLQLVTHRSAGLGAAAFVLLVRAGLTYLVASVLASNRTAVLALAWVLRVLGVLTVVTMAGDLRSPDYVLVPWLVAEVGVGICLYLVVGFWLAWFHKDWRRRQRRPPSTIPELDVQEPYVRYPRP